MGYNYYIPGRNDPFMEGGPCDLYCHFMYSCDLMLQLLRSSMQCRYAEQEGVCLGAEQLCCAAATAAGKADR
jgi:hypothetical protein